MGGNVGQSGASSSSAPATLQHGELLVWLRLVQLCLSLELLCNLPAPSVRVALPKENFLATLRLDEEYLNNRVKELEAAILRQVGTKKKSNGMATSDIAARCPAERLPATVEEECPVCLEVFEASVIVRRLPCGHLMHKECCEKWLQTSGTCPTCRRDVRS